MRAPISAKCLTKIEEPLRNHGYPVLPNDLAAIELPKDDEAVGFMQGEGTTIITFYKGQFQPSEDAILIQFGSFASSNP